MPTTRDTKIITKHFGIKDSHTYAVYKADGGYSAFTKAIGQQPAAIVAEVQKSLLRGRGGAGFSTGLKWTFLPKDAPGPGKPVYLVVNCDESEPGTCKDRELITYDPHMLIEGIAIASYALGAVQSYIYIRGEMIAEAKILSAAVAEAYAQGVLGKPHATAGRGEWKLDVAVHRGAGAYICGEETALLNSLEGKRGWPRLKPPFPAVKGLFGQPTIVNNVETLMNVPAIVDKGGEWFAGLGMGKSGGTRIVCLSGHVKNTGVYELPIGITFRELIEEVGGGVTGGKLKGLIPGGSSMPPLDPAEIDVPIEFDALMNDPRIKEVEVKPGIKFDMGGGRGLRTMAGSGGVVVFNDKTDVVKLCARIMRFYHNESCGQCTPCREGTGWLDRICERLAKGQGRPGDVDLLAEIAHGIAGNTICPLGEAAAWPMLGFLTKFRPDFEQREREGKPVAVGAPKSLRTLPIIGQSPLVPRGTTP